MSVGRLQRLASFWRAIGLLWLSGVVASWTLARSMAQALATSGIQEFPHGDAALFAPGGFYLLEAVTRSKSTLEQLLLGSLWELSLTLAALLLPFAIAVHELRALSVSTPTRLTGADLVGRATKSWPRFAVLGTAALLGQAACLALALLVVVSLTESLQTSFGAEHGAWLAIGVAVPICLPAWAVGVLRDVARVRSTGHAESAWTNVKVAAQIARVHWVRCALMSLGVALGSAFFVAVAAHLTTRFDVSRPGAWRVVSVALVHQTALLGIATLRVSWIGECVRLAFQPTLPDPGSVNATSRPRDDKSVRSDAPADPSSDPNASRA